MAQQSSVHTSGLRLLPAYTGVSSLREALNDPRSKQVLWLEILFNDQLDLGLLLGHPTGRAAYAKACRWFSTYRSLILAVIPRTPLPFDPGSVDQREYRTFVEALHFVSPDA